MELRTLKIVILPFLYVKQLSVENFMNINLKMVVVCLIQNRAAVRVTYIVSKISVLMGTKYASLYLCS